MALATTGDARWHPALTRYHESFVLRFDGGLRLYCCGHRQRDTFQYVLGEGKIDLRMVICIQERTNKDEVRNLKETPWVTLANLLMPFLASVLQEIGDGLFSEWIHG